MVNILIRFLIIFFTFLSLSQNYSSVVLSLSNCPKDDPCRVKENIFDRVACYTDIVNLCSNERESMTAQIIYLTSRIELTNSKIEATKKTIVELEKELEMISEKIDKLEMSLTKITGLFIDRIKATYKFGDISYLDLLLTGSGVSDIINRYKYIQTVQAHDRRLLFQLQNSKINFEDQKKLREEKRVKLAQAKVQLEKEQSTLAFQKKEKELFLETTRNSEQKYRQELAAARREAEGIQKAASILSVAGVSERVSRGDVIGIMGNTGFSTGPHLHLSVYNLKEADLNKFNFNSGYENPLNLLVSKKLTFEPNSCDDVSSSNRETKAIGNGSWEWPMSNPNISQCFGHTPWSWRYQSGIHNGLDMFDDVNPLIRAIDSGNAYRYRGGQSAGNGVFLFHDNGKMSLYWHLQ